MLAAPLAPGKRSNAESPAVPASRAMNKLQNKLQSKLQNKLQSKLQSKLQNKLQSKLQNKTPSKHTYLFSTYGTVCRQTDRCHMAQKVLTERQQ
jgi:hypothetical protein